LKAGPVVEEKVSVSPCERDMVEEISDGEEGIPSDMVGEVGERLSVPKDGENLRILKDPKLPSQEMVDRHYLSGHLPYRDWCPICVRAKGKVLDHQKDDGGERKLPEYSWDYCFPGDELGFKWTVLVGKERLTGNFFATAVPSKGGKGKFDVNRCLEFVDECGDKADPIIVKSDQEPAMTDKNSLCLVDPPRI